MTDAVGSGGLDEGGSDGGGGGGGAGNVKLVKVRDLL